MTKFLNISTDNTLGGNSPSDVLVASQKAVKEYVDNHGGGGSVAIDNSTITKNSSDEIQAVATVNANTAAGATNPIYDWVGTLAEYISQAVATNHPDWICYITDDLTAQAYDAYSKGQSDNLFVTKGHQVIEFQAPTAANNYTWYRKYKDGWVEQGGYIAGTSSATATKTLPVVMADSYYFATVVNSNSNTSDNATMANVSVWSKTTTGFSYKAQSTEQFWEVKGMAA